MKSILNFLLCLAFSALAYGQAYEPDQVIIQYFEDTSLGDQQAVRHAYGITSTSNLGDEIELWDNLVFPIVFSENGETEIINTIEELIIHIGIQNDQNGTTSTRSNVQNGDLDFILELEELGALHEGGTFTPLPYCSEADNERFVVPLPNGNNLYNDANVKIFIIDQLIPGMEVGTTIEGLPNDLGGDHGIKVHSAIDNILTQANITDVEYFSIPAFNANGIGHVSELVAAISFISSEYETWFWEENTRVIINFSANLIYQEGNTVEDVSLILTGVWGKLLAQYPTGPFSPTNALLISSAGNQGSYSNNVFPAGQDYFNEISVAGTQNCFSEPWESTNHDPTSFDIAAEAKDVLTTDGTDYFLSNGTSYSTALVTAAVAQLFKHPFTPEDATAQDIKTLLLDLADQVPALTGTVEQGRVLRIDNYVSEQPGGNGGTHGGIRPLVTTNNDAPLVVTPSPNPFNNTALITIELPQVEDISISLYNAVGQIVYQTSILNRREMTVLEWPTPDNLAPGAYILRVQAGDKVQQTKLIKQ